MLSVQSPSGSFIVHQENVGKSTYLPSAQASLSETPVLESAKETRPTHESKVNVESVALSFAYDAVAKSLNIMMVNKKTGETIRKVSFNQIPTELHRTINLQGLLLSHMV